MTLLTFGCPSNDVSMPLVSIKVSINDLENLLCEVKKDFVCFWNHRSILPYACFCRTWLEYVTTIKENRATRIPSNSMMQALFHAKRKVEQKMWTSFNSPNTTQLKSIRVSLRLSVCSKKMICWMFQVNPQVYLFIAKYVWNHVHLPQTNRHLYFTRAMV